MDIRGVGLMLAISNRNIPRSTCWAGWFITSNRPGNNAGKPSFSSGPFSSAWSSAVFAWRC